MGVCGSICGDLPPGWFEGEFASTPIPVSRRHANKGGRRTRPWNNSYSMGVLEDWGHKNLPEEIVKLYDARQQIGSGSTSKVFLALSRRSGKCSAMKVVEKRMMERDNLEQELLLKQLQKEIEIMRMLDHPNIIQYHNMVETSSKIYCFMELMTGGELFDYLYEMGPMKSKAAAYMMHGVVSAIDYMHSRNVVHRDIKAENLLLVSRNDCFPEVKIIDFGFSTVLKMTSTNSFLGTAGYLAPEIRQHRSYSKSVDIWALGVLIYLTLSCQLPFESETYDLPPDRLDVEGRFVLTFSEPAFKGPYAQPVRDLLLHMLDTDHCTRYNAGDCLRHPWLSGEHFGMNFPKMHLEQHVDRFVPETPSQRHPELTPEEHPGWQSPRTSGLASKYHMSRK
mmetsp:Transcript_3733/g.7898  ORF Transcript_3733/g.7898 Transcript_3733/m.7898 type:complete len:393 (-) Transcript_3733:166-1344(-)